MNSGTSLENYGKITILLEILAESQYSPPSHTQKPLPPKGLISWIFLSTQDRKQTMNLSSIVGSAICLTGTMSIIMKMILLRLIHMKGIPLDTIQIESISKNPPGCSRTAPEAQKGSRTTFANPVTILNSTRTSKVANKVLFTAQSRTLCRVTI